MGGPSGEYNMGGGGGGGGGSRHHDMSRHDLDGMDPYLQEAVSWQRARGASGSAQRWP